MRKRSLQLVGVAGYLYGALLSQSLRVQMIIKYTVEACRTSMPHSCWGHYGKVKLIKHTYSRLEVVKTIDRLNWGGERSALEKARRKLQAEADLLNAAVAAEYTAELIIPPLEWPQNKPKVRKLIKEKECQKIRQIES